MSMTIKDPGTHSMDRGCYVYMDPDTRPVKAQVGADEKACAGALGILPVLPQTEQKHEKPLQHPTTALTAQLPMQYESSTI